MSEQQPQTQTPKYSATTSAYLPVGPPDANWNRTDVYFEASPDKPAVIEYALIPNIAWTPLNHEAVEMQRELLKMLVTQEEECIAVCAGDRDGAKSRSLHTGKKRRLELQLKSLKVGAVPPPMSVEREVNTMSAMQKAEGGMSPAALAQRHAEQQAKGNRPSDNPGRK